MVVITSYSIHYTKLYEMNILLLGSTGILGKQVLGLLTRQTPHRIGVLLRKCIPGSGNDSNVLEFEGDILKKDTLLPAFCWADVVINCTGKVSYRRTDRKKLYQLHVQGTRNLVDLCQQENKMLVHTSSACIYGSSHQPIRFTETNVDPKRVYATRSAYYITKFESERVVIESNLPSYNFV